MQPDRLQELRVSDDARENATELRKRLGEDGYLFFRRRVVKADTVVLQLTMGQTAHPQNRGVKIADVPE